MSNQRRKAAHRRKQAEIRYEQHRRKNLLAEPGVNDFVIVLDNLKASFNVPKIFRSAQAFGANSVHLINIGQFDPAPAKGAFKYVPAKFYEDFDTCYQALKPGGYEFFILEPGSDTLLHEAQFPARSAFVMGNEELGISFDADDYPDIKRLAIEHHGKVESLNVSIAASIVMYQYCVSQQTKA
jgi:tRNA G18 (ribose-2'-O)-methylase SpoU